MSCHRHPFFSLEVEPSIVQNGQKWRDMPLRHTLVPIYGHMLLQICRNYSSLPDIHTLELHHIEFFYDGLRHELKQWSKNGK